MISIVFCGDMRDTKNTSHEVRARAAASGDKVPLGCERSECAPEPPMAATKCPWGANAVQAFAEKSPKTFFECEAFIS